MTPIPSTIGPYRVERELARGGMGVIYFARDTRLDRPVALKALPDDFASDPERLARFEREAKVLASLSHPNLAGIYGVEVIEGRRYHLLFSRGDALLAVQFNLDRLEIKGEPVAIAKGLRTFASWTNAGFGLSGDGTLVYTPGGIAGARRRLIVVNAQGHVGEWSGERQAFETPPSLSPDGSGVACVIANASGIFEIWVSERGRPARRLVAVPEADCGQAVWSPDGRQLAYTRNASDENDGIYVQPLDGSGAPRRISKVASKNVTHIPISWSPDGTVILFNVLDGGKADVFQAPALADGEKLPSPKPLFAGPGRERAGRFSPDGRWVAITSDESGKMEIYVAAYGPGGTVGAPVMVSAGGAVRPLWSRDGKQIFYVSPRRRVMSLALQTQPTLTASAPVPRWDLEQLRVNNTEWDILPDGNLLAIQKGEEEDEITRFDVVLNFFDELRQKVRAAETH